MRILSMNAYSKDLRFKTLAAIDRGIPRKEASELFGVSRSTIKRWLGRRRQTGDVNTHKIPGRPSVKGKALREWLPGHLRANPDLTLKEHCEAFEDESGVKVSDATMSPNIARLPGEWPSKKVARSSLRARRGSAGSMAMWLVSRFEVIRRLVFVDERAASCTPRWIDCALGLPKESEPMIARFPETAARTPPS